MPRADRAHRRRPPRRLPTGTARGHRALRLVSGVAALAVLAAGCSDDAPSSPATTAAPGTTAPVLPTTATSAVGGALGPTSVPDPTGTAPVVLTESVTAARSGPWWARGLVRNDGDAAVEAVAVTAVLLGADGRELTRAAGAVPVDVVGQGEPAPFQVVADVDAAAVAEVRWEIDATPATGSPATVEVGVFWTRPFGQGQPVSVPGYDDPTTGPLPFVLYGSATNTGGEPLAAPGVVAAWLGDDGRVLAVAEAPVLVAGAADPAPALAPGEALDVVIAVDDPDVGPSLEEAVPMFWGTAR